MLIVKYNYAETGPKRDKMTLYLNCIVYWELWGRQNV